VPNSSTRSTRRSGQQRKAASDQLRQVGPRRLHRARRRSGRSRTTPQALMARQSGQGLAEERKQRGLTRPSSPRPWASPPTGLPDRAWRTVNHRGHRPLRPGTRRAPGARRQLRRPHPHGDHYRSRVITGPFSILASSPVAHQCVVRGRRHRPAASTAIAGRLRRPVPDGGGVRARLQASH
jgi:hypothetical protein